MLQLPSGDLMVNQNNQDCSEAIHAAMNAYPNKRGERSNTC